MILCLAAFLQFSTRGRLQLTRNDLLWWGASNHEVLAYSLASLPFAGMRAMSTNGTPARDTRRSCANRSLANPTDNR